MQRILGVLLALAVLGAVAARAEQLTAEQILGNFDKMLSGFDTLSVRSTMTVVERDGTTKVREMLVWQQGDKRLVRFTRPASEIGIALLAMDSTTNYVFLPAYERVRRVAAHVRNQTFMGTDFSQEDMAITSYLKDYAPEILSESDTHWELELTRRPGASISYPKMVLLVSKERFTADRIDYYDRGGEKFKVEERSDFHFYNDRYWIAHRITMTSVKDNRQTLLENADIAYNRELPDDYFSERNLRRPLR